MKTYRSATVSDKGNDTRPMYYDSMAGNPYMDRMDSGLDISSKILQFEKMITHDETLNFGTDAQTFTIYHDLGYKPLVFGYYTDMSVASSGRALSNFNTPILGLQIWFNNIAENYFEIGYLNAGSSKEYRITIYATRNHAF